MTATRPAPARPAGSDNPWAEENPHAGKSAVVLDIGDGIGALVVTMPENTVGLEVEIVPAGTRAAPSAGAHADHEGGHPPIGHQHDGHRGWHAHGGEQHTHGPGAPPHVAVVNRPTPGGGHIPSLVFPALSEGRYDLYVKPDGPTALTAEVRSGRVTEAVWPAGG